MTLEEFFKWAWERYLINTPKVQKIVSLLEKEGESLVNDHIALRTFDLEEINIDKLSTFFTDLGYKEKGEYDFPAKKVRAKHYEKEGMPKIFLSELIVSQLPPPAQNLIKKIVAQIPEGVEVSKLFLDQRPWNLTSDEYKKLADESEYASWVAAWGFEPNHFTVLVNRLKKYDNLEKINAFLKENGFDLNTSGGEIKGSAEVYLEQSSIMADRTMVKFSDKEMEVPSCYYEFAYRHPLSTGEMFEGFVAASADKIFESTDELG